MRIVPGLLLALALSFGLTFGLTGGAARAAELDAITTVKKIYAGYLKKSTGSDMGPDQLAPGLYSKRRRAQIADLQRKCRGKDFCLPDFDHLIDGQDWKLSDFTVRETGNDGRTASLEVAFRNFDKPVHFVFTMVKEAGGWKIDEMAGGDGESDYRLDDVFKPNP